MPETIVLLESGKSEYSRHKLDSLGAFMELDMPKAQLVQIEKDIANGCNQIDCFVEVTVFGKPASCASDF